MTFSQSVKNEILKSLRHLKPCCSKGFLTAVFKTSGSLKLDYNGISFCLDSENDAFLKFCSRLAKEVCGIGGKMEENGVNAKGTPTYTCKFNGEIGKHLGFSNNDGFNFLLLQQAVKMPTEPCCVRTFLQGLFVSCGSVMIPFAEDDLGESKSASSKYHLEMRFTDEDFANQVLQTYQHLGLHKTTRKNYTVLYIKNSSAIADFFVYVNAMSAKLKLENIIIGRSIRNTANRQRNCIEANIEKAVLASERQLSAIAELKRKGLYQSLPQSLKDVAEIRQEFPEANLDEIASRLGISKSGANHRLARLIQLSQND
ncbi:MAG: DNA-binding protein WhiA [Clostridia bacterium]|nr:DNA-binding protein WhiA [Clostridia bacterium]